MKVILFEGPDKSGKTTLMQNIIDKMAFGETDEFGFKYKPLVLGRAFGTHPVYGADEQNKLRAFRLGLEAESVETMLELLPDEYVLFIDRFHLSEKVYGSVFKRGWDQGQFEGIDSLLCDYDTLLVHMEPADLVETYNKFPDDTGRLDGLTFEQYDESASLFRAVYAESKIMKRVSARVRFDDGGVSLHHVESTITSFVRG